MQFINTLLSFVFLIPILRTFSNQAVTTPQEEVVVLEILNKANAPFNFTMKYEPRRKIIKIKSERPIESMRIVDGLKNQKNYNVKGSDLIMLPIVDLKPGEHIAELKFQECDAIIISRITINEELI